TGMNVVHASQNLSVPCNDTAKFADALQLARMSLQDTIILLAPAPCVYNVSTTLNITGTGGGLTIFGKGAVLDGAYAVQIFNIASAAHVTINDLTIQNASNIGGNGGGIYNRGNLTLNNVALSGNWARGSSDLPAIDGGGGIYNDHGTLALNNSTL